MAFEKLYWSICDGTEMCKALEFNSHNTYHQDLVHELKEMTVLSFLVSQLMLLSLLLCCRLL